MHPTVIFSCFVRQGMHIKTKKRCCPSDDRFPMLSVEIGIVHVKLLKCFARMVLVNMPK